jgi:hypothetical protein
MKLRETVLPYVIQEVDYVALRQLIKQTFVEEYGSEMVDDVRVAHFNPNMIDAVVEVKNREPGMDGLALELGEMLGQEGVRVAIRISSNHEELTTGGR